MKEFFNYQSPYRTDIDYPLNIWERIIPLLLIGLCIYMIYKYRNTIRDNKKIEKIIRYSMGITLLILYVSHYALRINLYGITDTINLPFHLCSIAMVLCIIMIFSKNKTIHSFVLLAGGLGAIVSLSTPILGYDSNYYRYYQFFFAHGILIIAPIYFVFVHEYIPTKKDVINGFIILQSLTIFMMIFNYYNNTDFFFMFFDPSKIEKFPMIKYLGGIPYYIIFVEIFAGLYFFGSYKLFKKHTH